VRIDGSTIVCGLFGDPVAHSLSPAMHNAAFEELGLNWVYLPFRVASSKLSAAVNAVKALGMAGVNITVPHKEGVIDYLDELSDEAALIGAVNTVINREGCLIGDNTDGKGFIRSLEEAGFSPGGRTALILGSGGAARAVGAALARAGCRPAIANRTLSRAREIAGLLKKHLDVEVPVYGFGDINGEMVREFDLIVNTTPLGMNPHVDRCPPLPTTFLHKGQMVYDLVYNPRETKLMRLARASGARVMGGLGMLLCQGVLAFELWTGRPAPVEVMKKAINVLIKDLE